MEFFNSKPSQSTSIDKYLIGKNAMKPLLGENPTTELEMLRIFQAGEKDERKWLRMPLGFDIVWLFRANIQIFILSAHVTLDVSHPLQSVSVKNNINRVRDSDRKQAININTT